MSQILLSAQITTMYVQNGLGIVLLTAHLNVAFKAIAFFCRIQRIITPAKLIQILAEVRATRRLYSFYTKSTAPRQTKLSRLLKA